MVAAFESNRSQWGEGHERITDSVVRENRESRVLKTIIVFGQGPVKPVLSRSELTPQQQADWKNFTDEDEGRRVDVLHKTEPDFRLLPMVYQEKFNAMTQSERGPLMNQCQGLGRLGLNRWGRQNALAAGVALLSGATDRLILSGGKTKPAWAESSLSRDRLDHWPSEAELMRDIIVRIFGKRYKDKFNKDINKAIELEDNSTDTVQNFAFTLNMHPELLEEDAHTGIVGADFHVRRIFVLTKIFGVPIEPMGKFGAQEVLRDRARQKGKKSYEDILSYMQDGFSNVDFRKRLKGEERWERALIDPQYLSSWVHNIGYVDDPRVLRNVLRVFCDPSWIVSAQEAFSNIGLDFNVISESDIEKLQPKKLQELRNKLIELSDSTIHVVPPEQ